jgi:2-(1,2-epoxy-1,2-dihydrophenyl)acetyl-CoA isomerase
MSETILMEVAEGIATITLNRTPALNALNDEMSYLLRCALGKAAADPSTRCVIVTGAGRHFSAGGDLSQFQKNLQEGKPAVSSAMFADIHGAIADIQAFPKPVVASVRGAVAGIGLSLMSACDLVVAADNCTFTTAYSSVGLSPDGGSTYFLPRMVGMKRAMELLLLSDRYDSAQMLNFGLINRVVPEPDLDDETRKLVRRLAAGPAYALAKTKALLNASCEGTLQEQLDAEEDSFSRCAHTDDFVEGLAAFREKRKPDFGD